MKGHKLGVQLTAAVNRAATMPHIQVRIPNTIPVRTAICRIGQVPARHRKRMQWHRKLSRQARPRSRDWIGLWSPNNLSTIIIMVSDASELLTTEPVLRKYMSYPTPLVEAAIATHDGDAGGATPYACTDITCTDVDHTVGVLRYQGTLWVSGFADGGLPTERGLHLAASVRAVPSDHR